MQAIRKYVIPDQTGTIYRKRSFMIICLICAAFPMPLFGDLAVGFVQGDVFMSWRINNTDTSSVRLVMSPDGFTAVILFAPRQVIGNATGNYTNRVRDIGNISLGIVSFRLLNLTVADAGRYFYRPATGSDVGGQVLVIAGVPANVSIMEMADPFENKIYTVQCSAKPTSVPPGMGQTMHYQWKDEKGQNITVSDRYSFSSDQSNLIISPLMRQDAGTIVCEAWEHIGAVSKSGPFTLKVFYGPDPGSMKLSPNKTSYELTESSPLSVSCSTDCFPDCQYRWTGAGGSSPSNTELLSFISIGRNQAGQYTCIGSNSKIPDKTATATINVVVYYGPDDGNVFLSPGNTSYQLIELSSLAVQCAATCVPHCDYQWSGPLVSQNDSMGLLSVSKISRNQNGTFICTVINPRIPGKLATANFSVIVYYGPDTNGLTLSPSNTSYQLTEFSSLAVQCSATCVPQCSYQWMGPGISQNDYSGILSVSKISRNQTGTFTCTATNPRIPGKSDTANISVTVYYGPDAPITLNPNTTSYRNIESTLIPDITCSANCNPPCSYQWTGPLSATSSGVLSLRTFDRVKQGSYFCTATNSRTSASVNGSTVNVVVIYGPDVPQLSPSTTLYTKLEGQPLPDINCSTDCYPGCTQVWMKGVTAVEDSIGGTLALRMAYRDKAGVYTCWFNNTESRATENISVTLVVQYPPVLTMMAMNTSKGGRVVISCTASGVPDNYTFYRLTHMAPDVSRTRVRELEPTRVSGSEVSFTIERATYQDTGIYVCKASNGITHYSTGQVTMEEVVSVWIADQSVITSNVTDFDAEKGKSGYMHIEFYTDLFQPFVTWYRVIKNDTMELLQNSSGFAIYLSAVSVGVKYYQNTVHLPGYNASLEVFNVDEDQFTSYKVEINNSFGEPVYQILELKPRGPPETPTNLSVVPDSVTTHSLQLTWRAGFHGGASQTFVIEYRETGETNWLNKTEPRGLVLYVILNSTITDLKGGTTYEFRIYSENVFNRSHISTAINGTTETVMIEKDDLENPTGSPIVIGASTGSAFVLVIAVAVVSFLIYKRRQTIKSSKEDVDVLQDEKSLSDRCKSGLVDNPVYDSSSPLPSPSASGIASGDEYATVVKPKKKCGHVEDSSNLYAQVDKTNKEKKEKGNVKEKHGKTPRGEIYENATLPGRGNLKGNMYENSGDLKADETVYENSSEKASKGSLANKEGLMYADLMLDPPTMKNGKYVIRGLENLTEYADIAYGKSGEQLPDKQ